MRYGPSVGRRVAADVAAGLAGDVVAAGVEAGPVGRQAAAAGPAAGAARPTRPPSRRPGRCSAPPRPAGRRASAASRQQDLISAPVQSRSRGPALVGVEAEPLEVHPPDRLLLARGRAGRGRTSPSNRSARLNSGGSLRDVVARCRRRTTSLSWSLSQPRKRARTAGPRRPSRSGRWRRRRRAPSRPRRSSRRRAPSRRPAAAPGGSLASLWPTSEPSSAPTSRTSVGRPGLVAQGLAERALARARRPEQEHAPGADAGGPARPQGARAERLEGLQAAEVGERLAAAVQRQQARLLEHPAP